MVSQLYSGARILESATAILQSSLNTLEVATQDTKRWNKILKTEKVFGLVPERDVVSASEAVEAGAHPQIQYLLYKVEKEIAKAKAKRNFLQSNLRIQKTQTETTFLGMPPSAPDPYKIGRLKFLQSKRQRLEKVLSDRKRNQVSSFLPRTPSLQPR